MSQELTDVRGGGGRLDVEDEIAATAQLARQGACRFGLLGASLGAPGGVSGVVGEHGHARLSRESITTP